MTHPNLADGQLWPTHQPRSAPGWGWGRSLWIAWCILWAVGWLIAGLIFLPLLVLVPLSLFAIALGRPREVVIRNQ